LVVSVVSTQRNHSDVISTWRAQRLCARELDDAVLALVEKQYRILTGKDARSDKGTLSELRRAAKRVMSAFTTEDDRTDWNLSTLGAVSQLTAANLSDTLVLPLWEIKDAVNRALKGRWSGRDRADAMVVSGRYSRLKAVRHTLRFWGTPNGTDPKYAIACGAAQWVDKDSFGFLELEVRADFTPGDQSLVIPRGAPLPAHGRKVLHSDPPVENMSICEGRQRTPNRCMGPFALAVRWAGACQVRLTVNSRQRMKLQVYSSYPMYNCFSEVLSIKGVIGTFGSVRTPEIEREKRRDRDFDEAGMTWAQKRAKEAGEEGTGGNEKHSSDERGSGPPVVATPANKIEDLGDL
jgi:hypothetical protein